MRSLSFPLLTSIQITDSCNCNCHYCYNSNRQNQFMSEDDFRLVLDLVVMGKVFHLIIEGGEPFYHKDFFKFCSLVQETKLDYTIITNATLISSPIAKRISELDCNVIVSLDSEQPIINNKTRTNGEAALRGIDFLLAEGVPVGINTVISRFNIETCTDIISYFYPQVKRFAFLKLIHRSQNDSTVNDLYNYSQIQFRELGTKLGSYKKKHPEVKIISPFNFPNNDIGPFQESLDIPGCLAGTTYITIKPNLDVIPCSYVQDLVIGNLRNEDFSTIWESKVLQLTRSSHNIPCSINGGLHERAYCNPPGSFSSS